MKTRTILALALVLSFVLGGIAMAASVEPTAVDPWFPGGGAWNECGRAAEITGVEYVYACKIDNWDSGDMNGTYVCPGDDPDNLGDNEITISNSDGTHFDWSAYYAIGAVIVKGGTGANFYAYDPQAYSDTGLNGPGMAKGKKIIYPAVSHTTFCWNPEAIEYEYETAFAKGDSAGCFIDHGFNRWGWTNPITPGTYVMPVWAAAGQCDTSKGTYVGDVTVVYSPETYEVTASLELFEGYVLKLDEDGSPEEHLYAGTGMFPLDKNGLPTVAPGQYTNEGPFDGSPIYVIYHAVVGIPLQ